MRLFDDEFAEEIFQRLANLKSDTKPVWGKLTPCCMVHHLEITINYSIGKGKPVQFMGNILSRLVVTPLILHGLLKIPRNLPSPFISDDDDDGELRFDKLQLAVCYYLDLVKAGELETQQHPAFGDIGADGWARIHVLHFDHHLKQFEV